MVLQGTPPPFILLGVYTEAYLGNQQYVDQYLIGLDSWAGLSRTANRGHSISGDFINIEVDSPSYYIFDPLETLWNNGYADFINLSSTRTAAAIANGTYDPAIRAWADAYKAWVSLGGNRKAFIAPLEEMNGYWPSYGLDPVNFKSAYQRIQTIFAQAGVTPNQVWWTFAPNAYTRPEDPPIQAYYPGDDKVDVVALSAYNFGYCSSNPWPRWDNPDQAFGSSIALIRQQVTVSKPIFIAETGSTTAGGDKDQWIRSAYPYLVQQNVRGVLYYNSDKECDWAVYQPWPGGRQLQSYKDALSYLNARYTAPATLATLAIPP